jgi:hypothetical protein
MKKLIDFICNYAFIIHDGSAHNNFNSHELKDYIGNIRRSGRDIENTKWKEITLNH